MEPFEVKWTLDFRLLLESCRMLGGGATGMLRPGCRGSHSNFQLIVPVPLAVGIFKLPVVNSDAKSRASPRPPARMEPWPGPESRRASAGLAAFNFDQPGPGPAPAARRRGPWPAPGG